MGDFGRHGARLRVGLVVGLTGLLGACSFAGDDSDFAADTDAAEDSNATGPASASGSTTGTGEGSTDGASETDDGAGTDTGGSDLDEVPCLLDCGPDAACVADNDGPTCVCYDPGTAWAGSSCIPCTGVPTSFDVDVPVVDAEFRVTLDSASPPQTLLENGAIILRSIDTTDEFEVGLTADGTFSQTLVSGYYDVYYEYRDGGVEMPLNRSAYLGSEWIDNDKTIEVAIDRTLLSLTVTLNERVPSDSPTDYGNVVLVNPSTGDEVVLTQTSMPERLLWVVPGDYEVHYQWVRGEVGIPVNTDRKLQDVTIPHTDGGAFALAIDIPMVRLDGPIRLDGLDAPKSPTDYAELDLVAFDHPGDLVVLGNTADDDAFDRFVIPGTYQAYYKWRAGNVLYPRNRWAWLRELQADADATFEIQIPSIVATGAIKLDGGTPPADPGNDGAISLRTDDGDYVELGNTRDGEYIARIIPGSYSVYYSQETAGGVVPSNTNARVSDGVMSFQLGSTPDIDIATVTVSGAITLGGATPPTSEYDDARVYLRNPASGDSVLLGNTRQGSFSRTIVGGTYDIVYVVESPGTDVPVNTEATLAFGMPLDQDLDLPIDIPVVQISGQITLDQAAPSGGSATVVFQDVYTRDEVFVGTLSAPAFDQPLTAGRYLARYRGSADEYAGPINPNAAFRCFDIAAP